MFYSPSLRGFFLTAVHGSAIPQDALPVPPEAYAALMAAQAAGHVIQPGPGGAPVAVAPPALSAAEALEIERDGMVVSAFQAVAALAHFGKLAAVEALVAQEGGLTMLAWQKAGTFRRRSQIINDLAAHPMVALSAEELDELFRFAAEVDI